MHLLGGPRRAGLPALATIVALGALWPATALAADTSHKPCQGQDVPISKWTIDDAERTSLCLVNLFRQANGKAPLTLDEHLAKAARGHSADMVERDYFGHNAPDPAPAGTTPRDRATTAGYRTDAEVGENYAASPSPDATPRDLFESWSQGANGQNVLGGYATAAVGLALGAPEVSVGGAPLGPDGVTGTQMFGTLADGGTDTALDLAGGNPKATPSCKRFKRARHRAKKRWRKAREARKAVQKARKHAKGKRKRKLTHKLMKKRRLVAKRRRQLRRASRRQQAACPSGGKGRHGKKPSRGKQSANAGASEVRAGDPDAQALS